MQTNELIAQLSQQAPQRALPSPAHFGVRVGAVLLVYGVGVQCLLHVRPDITAQLARPLFVLEILLLAGLAISSVISSVLGMYPDRGQARWALNAPYGVFAALLALIVAQLAMPQDVRMAMPNVGMHGMECALCIASLSIIPAGLILGLQRKGASVHPLRAGSFAVLAASAVGCLTLRLAEANDALSHLAGWHYLPTLAFAALGAAIGKAMLRW